MMMPSLLFVGCVFVAGVALGSGHWMAALLVGCVSLYCMREAGLQAAERDGRR